jgi:hypothetical protein
MPPKIVSVLLVIGTSLTGFLVAESWTAILANATECSLIFRVGVAQWAAKRLIRPPSRGFAKWVSAAGTSRLLFFDQDFDKVRAD